MRGLLQGLVCLVGTVLGVTLAFSTNQEVQDAILDLVGVEPRVVLGVLMGGVGYLLGATFSYEFDRWLEDVLPEVRIRDVIWGGAGALAGMVAANLLLLPVIFVLNLGKVHEVVMSTQLGRLAFPVAMVLVPVSFNLFMAYLGGVLLLRKEDEIEGLLMGVRDPQLFKLAGPRRYLLDTSAIIDGRVAELIRLGLLTGAILVPRFVLEELQLLADSSDDAKRRRGQRGLEILEALKADPKGQLILSETDFEDSNQVDDKLVRYARSEPATLVTNDYNLAKIAGLEGIETFSLHSLADVMRPVALPGERLEVEVVKTGKEKGQGVGYLADGTMVVVRDGADRQGERLVVQLERVLQTSAGRMVFAHPVEGEEPTGRRDPTEPIPLRARGEEEAS